LQAALEDCDKALQTDLGSAAAYDSRGLIHLKMGKLSAAIGDYNSALRLDPKAGERASWPWICQAQNRRHG
jgi:Tfp pilus assembly protein PilF